MPGTSNNEYEEIWEAVISGGNKYELSKRQAEVLMQEMATGNRGIIPFETFVISIPYVTEFYRVSRFLKNSKTLPSTVKEEPYIPIPKDKWEKMKREAYEKIGKKI